MSFRGVVLSRGICRGAGNWAYLRGFPAGRGGVREVPGALCGRFPRIRGSRRRGAVRRGVAQDADRVAVVFDGRPAGHDVAHRGHQAQCGHGEYAEQHLRPPVAVAEAQSHEQGHAHGQPDLGEGLGQQPDRRFAQARADHLIHRPVELAEHHREGIVDLDVGIAAEGLGHEPRLFALRLVFQLPVAVDAVAHQSVIEPDRGQEDRQGEQCREGRVPHQRPEQQHEQHRLGGDGGGGFEHARREGQADDVDVAGQYGRVRRLDERQPPVVVGDEQPPRERAVECEDIVAFDAGEPQPEQALQDDHAHHGRADRQRETAL